MIVPDRKQSKDSFLIKFWRFIWQPEEGQEISAEERQHTYEKLCADHKSFQDNSVVLNEDTALFVFDNVRATANRKDEGIRNLDGRAIAILGIFGGIATALHIGTTGLEADPTAVLGIMFFATGFFLAIGCLWVRRRTIPSVAHYIYGHTIELPRALILMASAEGWAQYSRSLEKIAAEKARLIRFSITALSVGTILIFMSTHGISDTHGKVAIASSQRAAQGIVHPSPNASRVTRKQRGH